MQRRATAQQAAARQDDACAVQRHFHDLVVVDQIAAGVQGVVEQTVHVLLDIGLEINQQVAAHDEVETGERRVLDQVVDGKETHLADFLRDLVHVIVPDEESLQALRRDVLGDAFGVAAVARELQRLVVDVPGEDLHPRARVLPQNLLSEQDRHRVRFLAGRAAGRPHPEGPVQRCDVHEARDHIAGQYGECLWVPEEVRHADEQIAEQLVRFARAIAQVLDVCRDRRRLEDLHAPLDAPHQRRRLIAPEVMPRLVH